MKKYSSMADTYMNAKKCDRNQFLISMYISPRLYRELEEKRKKVQNRDTKRNTTDETDTQTTAAKKMNKKNY